MEILTNFDMLSEAISPLYFRAYDGTGPFAAYLQVHPPDRRVSQSHEFCHPAPPPPDVVHGRVIRFDLPPTITGPALADMLTDPHFLGLLEQMCDRHESVREGPILIGQLSPAGMLFLAAARDWLEDFTSHPENRCRELTSAEWVAELGLTTPLDSGSEPYIIGLGTNILNEARRAKVIIIDNLGDYLRSVKPNTEA